ncbi:phosphatidylglycerophosphatase A [Marinobacteraceae bacterium S3BR75-40.1]
MTRQLHTEEPELENIEQLLPPGFLRNPVHFLAFGFGSGCMAQAPGTWGTLAALPVYACFFWVPLPVYLGIVALAFVVGIWLCGRTAKTLKVHDHGGIVWDEFVGMWLVLAIRPDTWYWLVLAVVLFRFFDILKPWPIGWLDRRVGGGFGIMLDDILAGLYALVSLYLAIYFIAP